jgi:signal transduction histidine kinase
MFYRANEKSDGSGIGLYIVKQAVEKLNGSISVKSKKGEGTRFQVTIPNADSHNLN